MKKLGFIAMTMLACCLLVTPLASQGQKTGKAEAGNAEEQIKALQAELIQAILKGDTSFYQKYFVDDVVIVHGNGGVNTKAQEIEALKSGSLKYDSYTVRDLKIRMYGSTAVVDTESSEKGVFDSKPFDTDFRVTYVWVKLKGDWKLVARHITRIAKG
jgi:ketosteroid isomerase-like protein